MIESHCLIGKTITAIKIATDGCALRFDIEDSPPIVAYAEGDCCSTSWVESLDLPEAIIGSPVIAVEDIEMPDLGDQPGHDCMAYYGCKIRTVKGECVIDYRNDSNGYYGGYLIWPPRKVYGIPDIQDVSKYEWRDLA